MTTAAPPPRDSVLDALGYAARVFTKPGFLWAPVLLSVVLALPLLGLPGLTGTTPQLTTQAEIQAYLQRFIPPLFATLVVATILGPLASAATYRLSQQYIDGQEPDPFGPGVVSLAWRYFLQTLVFVAVGIALLVAFVLAFTGLQAITGWGLAFVITAVAAVVAYLLIVLRLGLAPVMLLWGAGPIESIGRSWRLTEGHLARVFRWLIVTALIIGVVSSVLGGMVGAIFGSVGLVALAQVVAAAIAAPFSLVYTTVFILLARLLSSPDAPQPPSAAVLPDWMQQTSPATPTAPPTPEAPPTPAGPPAAPPTEET